MFENQKRLANQSDASHNSMSFFDDLSLQIANVRTIKLENIDDDDDELDGGSATHEFNDVFNFLTTSNESGSMTNLDFLIDADMNELASDSQPQPYNFDDAISTDANFNFCDPESIKSDCMWSSTLSNIFGDTMKQSPPKRRRVRKRDFSLTLSECAEGMSGIAPIDMLHTTPPAGGTVFEGALWTPLNICNYETDSAEEVDVETPYVSPLQQHEPCQRKTSIEPGIFLFTQ